MQIPPSYFYKQLYDDAWMASSAMPAAPEDDNGSTDRSVHDLWRNVVERLATILHAARHPSHAR